MKTVYSTDNKIESLRELLPWYITDSLSTDEKKELEAALEKHDFLREELEQERELAKLLSAETDDENLVQAAQAQQQKRLDNLLGRIDFAESALLQEPEKSSQHTLTSMTENNRQAKARTKTKHTTKRSYISVPKTYFAYAASFAFLLSSAFIIYNYLSPSQSINGGTGETTYVVSSFDGSQLAPKAETKKILWVSFTDVARQQEISELLFKINARIIDGPDHSMTYRIEIKGEPTQEQLDAAMKILKENGSLITFVGKAS